MWKAFLLLVCVAGCACEDDTNSDEVVKPGDIASTDSVDATNTDWTKTCRCGGGGYPPICPKNEIYYNCSGGCIPRLCSELGYLLNCDKCTPGCVCKDSFARADNGTCIPILECPTCKGDKNAQLGCGNNCGRTCSTYNKPPIPCPPGCIFNGCNCRKGFVYDNNVKACVKPEACTPICKANEEYSPCVNGGCDARNCSQIGKPVPCVKLSPKSCIKGCVCVKGYLRASNGTCIPKELCTAPRCDKLNEVYDVCPAPCPPKRCDVDEAVFDCAPPPIPGDPDCNPGCRCADNYYRNATGACVLKKNCEKPLKCRSNEIYDACPAMCPPQKCGINPALILCKRNPQYGDPACKPSCVCIDLYVRDDDKQCVPRDRCPKKCGKNEHWDKYFYNCGSNETCDVIGKSYSCPEKQEYQSGCRCDEGYWRNTDKECVPESECHVENPCKQNDYWQRCIPGCRSQSCNDLNSPPSSCPGRIVGLCNSGCRCKPKHYRNSDGICIPEAECPRCGWNELWVKCNEDCSNQTCEDIGKVIQCPNQPAGQCKSGCRCRPGGFRNASNVCVPKEACPKFKCNCNEEHIACPAFCPGENCSDFINKSKCPPGRIGTVLICKPQCKCIKGYYRDSNGTCIRAYDCLTETPSIATTTIVPPTDSGTGTSGTGTSGSVTGLASVLDGITAFTGKCLYDRMQSAPSANIIMSPMSLFTPIAELCLYSEGPAYDQCIKTLNLQDKQDIRDTFPKLASSYEGQSSVNFSTAAKVYSNENYELSNGFKKNAVDVFHAEAQELNFAKNAEAADTINAWVASKTNNRIKDILQPDMLSASTLLVLVNAIYFKGTWLYEFNKNNTKEENFYLSEGTTKKTKLMYQEIKDLEYGEIPSLDCKVVRVLYKGKNSSMIFVLPNTKNGTTDLAKNLQNPDNWKKVTDSLQAERVRLYIPSFEISTTTNLKDLLKKAGIINWFNCNNSGLTGLLAKPEKICITDAIQKAWIKVDEEGSEAAAANGIIGRPRPGPPPPLPKEFRADHPFLYFLRVQSISMFCGVYLN